MSATNNPISQKSSTKTKLFEARATLAAAAGASEIFNFPIGVNRQAIVRGVVRAAAGVVGAAVAFTVTNADETFTSASAHGITTGTPVVLGGTLAPTGLTLGNVYFAKAVTATTITLHPTSADAVAGTNTSAVTGDGTAVTLTPTVTIAAYQIFGAAINRVGNTVLVGTPVIDSLEDVSGWACTVTVDNTNDTIQVKITPDTDNATRVEAILEVVDTSADIVV